MRPDWGFECVLEAWPSRSPSLFLAATWLLGSIYNVNIALWVILVSFGLVAPRMMGSAHQSLAALVAAARGFQGRRGLGEDVHQRAQCCSKYNNERYKKRNTDCIIYMHALLKLLKNCTVDQRISKEMGTWQEA
jgi:hypothetical protein